MKRIFIFIVLACLSIASAGSLQCNFPYTNVVPASDVRWIAADMSITPSISAPQATICTGTDFTPELQVGSVWFTNSYDARLDSFAVGSACLIPSTQQSQNQQVLWITPSQYQQIVNLDYSGGMGSYFSDMAAFNQFASAQGIPVSESAEMSRYASNFVPSTDYSQNGNFLFKSGISVYCKGTLRLVSTTSMPDGSSYSQVLASDYLGTIPSSYTKPNSVVQGTAKFALRLDVSGCRAFGRTYMSSQCPTSSPDSVWIYGDCPALPSQQTGSEVTVNFENPFTCSIAASAATVAPLASKPGTSFSVNFTLTNNAVRPIAVDSITLSDASKQYFDAAGTSFTKPSGEIAANGGTAIANGTVKVKPSTPAGTYQLSLKVNYHSTQADCNLSNNMQCSAPALVIINVVVGNLPNCTLVMSNHSLNMSLSDSARINASCSDENGPIPCPPLAWSHNAAGDVSMVPPQTAGGMAPFSTLTVGASAPPQLGRSVSAVSTNPDMPISCSPAPFNLNPYGPGTYVLNCNFPGYGASPAFFTGQSIIVQANCTKSGSQFCPGLNWNVSITGSTVQPTYTAGSSTPPQATLAMPLAEPGAILRGNVTISCADPMECTANGTCPFMLSPRPTNMTCACLNHGTQFSPNDWALLQANCTKTGVSGFVACPTLQWEAANLTGTSFNPNPTPAAIQPTTNFSTINAPVPQSGAINANSITAGITLQCASPILAGIDNIGPDYVVTSVKTPSYLIEPGTTFQVSVNVSNIGNRNVTSTVSQTALLAGNCSESIQLKDTGPLKAGQSAAFQNYVCACNSAGTFRVTAVADYNNDITGELDEGNNRNYSTYVCGITYAPACFDYI